MTIDLLNRLPVQPWMHADGARRVMRALNAGAPDSARFVGGCVRNALLGLPASDIDIATVWEPEEVIRRMKANNIGVHPTGIEHGTVTAVANNQPYEITTLRRDVSTDGRRATVAFTKDWNEDAQRRDFHVNALYCDLMGNLSDPTGLGISDLREQKIAFIGDADTRLQEDYLRILRFFRFNAWYGSGSLDVEGLSACMRQRAGLDSISVERIWSEFKKLLSAPDPRVVLEAMSQIGVLQFVLPEAIGLDLFNALVALELEEHLKPDPYLRLLSLYPKDMDVVAADVARLKMSNSEKKRLLTTAGDNTSFAKEFSAKEFRRTIYSVGKSVFESRARLAWAVRGREAKHRYWRVLINAVNKYERPIFPISGEHVIAVGVPAGKPVGEVLKRIEQWWIDEDFPLDIALIARQMRIIADEVILREKANSEEDSF
ncbi:CCA tRNA nucleotidyltransferase [Hirschia litorea]|uniref:CCA tRNA nucleotidyltransferase n=1 Tax=Hirschia litorea TaxID=1199156 RepID=A0ABW2IKF0_9PROT